MAGNFNLLRQPLQYHRRRIHLEQNRGDARRTKSKTKKLVDFRWSHTKEAEIAKLWFLRILFSADHFWTSLFSHQLHRGGHKDLQQEGHGSITTSSPGHSSGHSWWKKQICNDQNQQEVDISYRHLRS